MSLKNNLTLAKNNQRLDKTFEIVKKNGDETLNNDDKKATLIKSLINQI